MKRIILAIAICGSMVLAPTGCKTAGVTGQPTAPSQSYPKAAQLMSDFATDLQQVQSAEQADALINAQASAMTIRARINSAIDSATAITLQTGKLDPNTAAQLKNAVTAIKILLGNVLNALPTPIAEVTYGSYRYSYAG
jgi:hypothetical protein